MQRRRVVIEITVDGSPNEADLIRDAIGSVINDEILMPACVEVMEREGIEDAKWEVRGEKWVAQ